VPGAYESATSVLVGGESSDQIPVRAGGECADRHLDIGRRLVAECWTRREVEQSLLDGRDPTSRQIGVDTLDIEPTNIPPGEDDAANRRRQRRALLGNGNGRDRHRPGHRTMVPRGTDPDKRYRFRAVVSLGETQRDPLQTGCPRSVSACGGTMPGDLVT
jgi:hypothetical protein